MKKKINIKILIKPIITEKSLKLVDEQNQYTFLVGRYASKGKVKSKVEKKFNVTVLKTRIINIIGKKVSWGKKRISGRRSDRKKAIVTLKKSDSIDLFKVK